MPAVPSYRNRSIDLSIDWFLYEGDTVINALSLKNGENL